VTIEVAECYLLAGAAPLWEPLPLGGPEDLLLVDATAVFPVTLVDIPTFAVPDVPGMAQARFYFQVIMINPLFDPADPVKVSGGLEMRVNGPTLAYGPETGIHLRAVTSAAPGREIVLAFDIDGM
jgi:hypothetical protein